jgi:hypothetical protein
MGGAVLADWFIGSPPRSPKPEETDDIHKLDAQITPLESALRKDLIIFIKRVFENYREPCKVAD